jgi:hypothetical protein
VTQNLMADVDAAVVEVDLSAIRQQMDVLETENARLNDEVERLKADARRRPVALLPEIGFLMAGEYFRGDYAPNTQGLADAMNAIIRSHFRESAEARVRPVVDVDAILKRMNELWQTRPAKAALEQAVREHFTDAPAPPADELLMNALARVERETQRNTRRECAAMARELANDPLGRTIGIASGFVDRLADRMERGQ